MASLLTRSDSLKESTQIFEQETIYSNNPNNQFSYPKGCFSSRRDNDLYFRELETLQETTQDLQEKQDILEAEKETLVNQVGDLRLLLKRVAKEGEKNLRRAEGRNHELQEKVKSLESSLAIEREYGSYFDRLSCYWQMLE